jgi:hypothetical protein
LLKSSVSTIHEKDVEIKHNGAVQRYPNDAVIVCAGGLLPTPLLQKIGIEFATKFGTA